jgi:hypothetical protein
MSGRAQWEIKQTTSRGEKASKLGGSMYVVRCAQLRTHEPDPIKWRRPYEC